MRNVKQVAPILLILAVACASVGGGDPVVVRAEDLKVNSQTIYEGVIRWHDGDPAKGIPGHSTMESPAVYRAIEKARVEFDPAWRKLSDGIRNYKANKAQGMPGAVDLQALMNAVQSILDTLPAVPATGGH